MEIKMGLCKDSSPPVVWERRRKSAAGDSVRIKRWELKVCTRRVQSSQWVAQIVRWVKGQTSQARVERRGGPFSSGWREAGLVKKQRVIFVNWEQSWYGVQGRATSPRGETGVTADLASGVERKRAVQPLFLSRLRACGGGCGLHSPAVCPEVSNPQRGENAPASGPDKAWDLLFQFACCHIPSVPFLTFPSFYF